MPEEHCTMVNPYCPDDLCVLEYGHAWSSRHRHLTGTRYGSANTNATEQAVLLRSEQASGWGPEVYEAPKGTPVEVLIELGWRRQRELDDA